MAKNATRSTPVQSIFGMTPAKAGEMLAALTEREQQVAVLMADGLKNMKIAKQLGISTKTLDIHRAHLKRKLKADTSVAVARIVLAERFGEHLR